MATIREKGPYQWQVQIRRKGWPYQHATFRTRRDAEAWARKAESNMDRGLFVDQSAGRDSERGYIDHKPVVKLFTPDAGCTWLITELDPDDPDIAFGLCDLGMGFPEIGIVRISELESLRGCLSLPVERDLHFEADKTLMGYAAEAHKHRAIRA